MIKVALEIIINNNKSIVDGLLNEEKRIIIYYDCDSTRNMLFLNKNILKRHNKLCRMHFDFNKCNLFLKNDNFNVNIPINVILVEKSDTSFFVTYSTNPEDKFEYKLNIIKFY